jgi:Ca-activated chloride channel family protein
MDFTDPQLAEPRWLWLAVLGPLALLALRAWSARARRRQLAAVASPRFLEELLATVSMARRRVKFTLLCLAVAGLGVALARPQWGKLPETIEAASEDVLILLDASRSMLANDVAPTRLERARLAVLDFLQQHPGGRVGLVVFAGQAFLQCPLTFDHEAFQESLLAVDANTIPVGGTDLGRALREALHAVETPGERQVLILLSDGEDLEQAGPEVAREMAATNIVLHTVGVGTSAGSQIPVRNEQGVVDLLRDDLGRVVQTRLNEDTLRAMAQATRGTYQPLGALGEGLTEIQLQMATERSRDTRPAGRAGIERFQFPLAAATLLLVTESLIGTRRGRRRKEAQA